MILRAFSTILFALRLNSCKSFFPGALSSAVWLLEVVPHSEDIFLYDKDGHVLVDIGVLQSVDRYW